MITTIIFDWGGVFRGQAKFSTFIHKMCKKYNVNDFSRIKKEAHLLWEDAKIERISSNVFLENLAEEFGITADEFEKDLIKHYKHNSDLVKIAEKLKYNGYKVGVFTNNIKKWFEDSLKEVGLEDFFDYVITSYDYKLAKPQKEIYEKVLELIGENSEDILFIDDLDRNLKPARELGFNTYLFVDNQELLNEFDRLKIKYE